MTELTNPRAFRAAREAEWQRLDDIVTRAETKSVRALGDDELVALPVLYRGALSSLSVARETSLDLELVSYLEGLCARAYFFVYGVRTSAWRRLGAFFARDWPRAVQSLWRETLVALALTAIGAVAGYLLVNQDTAWFDGLFPFAGDGRNFNATADYLRDVLYSYPPDSGLSILAAFLFTHNAQVAMLSFALGFAFGMPTAMLLIYNGATLGALFALYASHGLEAELAGWIVIHGSTELFAIMLAGAAGFRIGWSVVFPGERSRLAAASASGRTAALAMAGVVAMLFVAGLLEGFGRQLVTDDAARYAIGAIMLLAWCLYFYWPRGRAHD
ncbi:MAG TPA: stage II sporulation protein M [Allosphingosinicella sp.]|nr:stage II sporulation protein M [Allosphingosinicella sp.]